MKPLIVSVCIIFFVASKSKTFAQGRDNYWPLGYDSYSPFPNVGGFTVNFPNNSFNYFDYPRGMWFDFTNAAICNDTGALLFYTNGVYIANSVDDTMMYGSGLNPSFYTTQFSQWGLRLPQADIILPKPSADSIFYVFHETKDISFGNHTRALYLYFSVVNANANNGLGVVIKKNDTLITDTLFVGAITACKHANGRDWWLLIPEYGNNLGFYSILITPDSLQLINHNYFPINGLDLGQACFSPDGGNFIISHWWGAAFFDFDRCTGILSLKDTITFTNNTYCVGASVSPNSRFAYIGVDGGYIFQFDLQAPIIPASLDTVAIFDGYPVGGIPARFFLHQLAPNGKIYIATGNTTWVYHVINYPDSAGVTCSLQQHAVIFQNANNSIPNFPNYNLGPIIGSVCDSLGMGVSENALQSFGLRVNPNPCSNYFYLNYNIATNKNLLFVLYDSFGKEVLRRNLYGTTKYLLISTQGLSDGVYFGAVSDGVKREAIKIVIIKN